MGQRVEGSRLAPSEAPTRVRPENHGCRNSPTVLLGFDPCQSRRLLEWLPRVEDLSQMLPNEMSLHGVVLLVNSIAENAEILGSTPEVSRCATWPKADSLEDEPFDVGSHVCIDLSCNH